MNISSVIGTDPFFWIGDPDPLFILLSFSRSRSSIYFLIRSFARTRSSIYSLMRTFSRSRSSIYSLMRSFSRSRSSIYFLCDPLTDPLFLTRSSLSYPILSFLPDPAPHCAPLIRLYLACIRVSSVYCNIVERHTVRFSIYSIT